jgi:hypothetical protein
MYRLLMTGHRPERTGVLFMPFRTRTAHVVQFGPIGIKNPFRGSAPHLDRHRQTGRREDRVSGRFGRSEYQNGGAAHGDHLIWSVSRPIDGSVDCGCFTTCAMTDCKASTGRALYPRLRISNATSWAIRSLSSLGSRLPIAEHSSYMQTSLCRYEARIDMGMAFAAFFQ